MIWNLSIICMFMNTNQRIVLWIEVEGHMTCRMLVEVECGRYAFISFFLIYWKNNFINMLEGDHGRLRAHLCLPWWSFISLKGTYSYRRIGVIQSCLNPGLWIARWSSAFMDVQGGMVLPRDDDCHSDVDGHGGGRGSERSQNHSHGGAISMLHELGLFVGCIWALLCSPLWDWQACLNPDSCVGSYIDYFAQKHGLCSWLVLEPWSFTILNFIELVLRVFVFLLRKNIKRFLLG